MMLTILFKIAMLPVTLLVAYVKSLVMFILMIATLLAVGYFLLQRVTFTYVAVLIPVGPLIAILAGVGYPILGSNAG